MNTNVARVAVGPQRWRAVQRSVQAQNVSRLERSKASAVAMGDEKPKKNCDKLASYLQSSQNE